jgi:hypothetical protein
LDGININLAQKVRIVGVNGAQNRSWHSVFGFDDDSSMVQMGNGLDEIPTFHNVAKSVKSY